MICGKYVKTFKEASHALPDGMHMNADYPFKLPKILKLAGRDVVLRGRDTDGTFRVMKRQDGTEYCVITQSSSYESIFRRPPAKFKAYPFKDENTPAIGGPQEQGSLDLVEQQPSRDSEIKKPEEP